MADAFAPVAFTASATVAKTGLPRCVSPAFFGFVPPTTFVPVKISEQGHRIDLGIALTIVNGTFRVEAIRLSVSHPTEQLMPYHTFPAFQ